MSASADQRTPPRRRRTAAEDAFARLEQAQAAAAVLETSETPLAVQPSAVPMPVLTGQVVQQVAVEIPDEPDFALATATDPEGQFTHYDATISRARAKVEKVLTKAERYWRLTAGPALKEIRDGGLYRAAGFASFEKYVTERWDMSRARAYQLIDSVRAMQALESATQEVPNERQLRAILPVLDEHGVEAAQKVWRLAEERGRTSGAALEQAAIDLQFRKALEAVRPESQSAESAWPRYEPVLRALNDLRGLRQVATESPARARELAARLRQAAAELEADLPSADEN